jgi:hypothetical protein
MSTEQVVALLTAERDRLNQVITLLSGNTTTAAPAKRRGRPPGRKAAAKLPTPMTATPATMPKPARRKRRKLSAEARANIAAAQKKRWAEYRKK